MLKDKSLLAWKTPDEKREKLQIFSKQWPEIPGTLQRHEQLMAFFIDRWIPCLSIALRSTMPQFAVMKALDEIELNFPAMQIDWEEFSLRMLRYFMLEGGPLNSGYPFPKFIEKFNQLASNEYVAWCNRKAGESRLQSRVEQKLAPNRKVI